jgi:hypothetical protein
MYASHVAIQFLQFLPTVHPTLRVPRMQTITNQEVKSPEVRALTDDTSLCLLIDAGSKFFAPLIFNMTVLHHNVSKRDPYVLTRNGNGQLEQNGSSSTRKQTRSY